MYEYMIWYTSGKTEFLTLNQNSLRSIIRNNKVCGIRKLAKKI